MNSIQSNFAVTSYHFKILLNLQIDQHFQLGKFVLHLFEKNYANHTANFMQDYFESFVKSFHNLFIVIV